MFKILPQGVRSNSGVTNTACFILSLPVNLYQEQEPILKEEIMTENVDTNGLTEEDRRAAERTEAMIERLRDQSMRNIHLQSAASIARTRANMIQLGLRR